MKGSARVKLLEARGVSFSYGVEPVLSDVSISLERGEIVAILGPNGAGKSTLVGSLSGNIGIASGEVLLDGKPLREYGARDRARRIAVVAQETHIPFPFTALEIVLMGRAPYLPAMGFERRIDVEAALHAMDAMDCKELADRDIGSLSGGERRRVVVARALAQETPILLLDEPTNFLDIRHASDLAGLLREHAKSRGTAICAVMHDLNLAAGMCDRMVLLSDGKILADGPPAAVMTPESIGRAFGTKVSVGTDASSLRPYCIPSFD